MRLTVNVVKLFASVVYLAGVLIVSLFGGAVSLMKSAPKGKRGSWWDYDRNTLDNDIEQISRTTKEM